MKKKKRLTQSEIKYRAMEKKHLQEEGILPPNKPRLNRRKFAEEVMAEYYITLVDYEDMFFIRTAIDSMVYENMKKVTPEELGVLKMLKIAVEHKKFLEARKAEGREKYTLEEYFDNVVRPVIKL